MDAVFMSLYESLKDLAPQIRQQINIKKSSSRDSIAFNKTTVRIKTLLNTFESDRQKLRNELERLSNTKRYPGIDKREKELNEINTIYYQLQQESEQINSSSSRFGTSSKNFNDQENVSENTPHYTADQARDRQMLLIKEQDRGMDMLGEILTKQKFIARDMCEEITVQNEIIDDITTALDNADQRLERNIRNTKKISSKSGTCGLWMLIVLLFVVDIVIALI